MRQKLSCGGLRSRRRKGEKVLDKSVSKSGCEQLARPSWSQASQVAQLQRIHLPVEEMCVQSLDWEDLLEQEVATHSSSLAWQIPWTEDPGS